MRTRLASICLLASALLLTPTAFAQPGKKPAAAAAKDKKGKDADKGKDKDKERVRTRVRMRAASPRRSRSTIKRTRGPSPPAR